MLVTDFYDEVMSRLPGLEETLARQEIFAAARKFCEAGWGWVYYYGPVDIPANDPVIDLDQVPTNTSPGYALRVEFKSVNASAWRPLTQAYGIPRQSDDTNDNPSSYLMLSSKQLQLFPEPTLLHTDGLRCTITLIPTADTVVLPDEFETHWRDGIIAGALHRLMAMPSKPWTDKQLAVHYGKVFRNDINRSRIIVKQRYGPGNKIWTFPHFAAQMR